MGLGARKAVSATPAGESRYLAPAKLQHPAKAERKWPNRVRKKRRKRGKSEKRLEGNPRSKGES